VLLAIGAGRAEGQQPMAYLDRGIGSYRALEYDSAAGWLRRALTPPLVEALPLPEQVRGLAYLGATEQFRGRSDSAVAAFRRMLRLDPASRPDPLIFPPEVTKMFDEVRVTYPILAISAPPEARIDRTHPSYPIQVRPSAPHNAVVLIERTDRRSADTIYVGMVADPQVVEWDGRDRRGAPVPSGRYWITATPVTDGSQGCRVRVPLGVTLTAIDTLPAPPPFGPAQLLPERADRRTGPTAFAGAVLLGAAAFALPAITPDADPTPSYAVGGVLGVTGVVGLIRYRSGEAIPENIAANATARARWQQEAERIGAVNAERRKGARLELHTSAPVLVGCEAP